MESTGSIRYGSGFFPSLTNPIIDKEATTVETVYQTHSSSFYGHSLGLLSGWLQSRGTAIPIESFVLSIRIGFGGWNGAVHYRQLGWR